MCLVFFFNDTATTEIYTLSLHDALPICLASAIRLATNPTSSGPGAGRGTVVIPLSGGTGTLSPRMSAGRASMTGPGRPVRSEEHTSELQSRQYLVCRLLLEKKK